MKKYIFIVINLMILLTLSACSNKEDYAHSFLVYYINNEETGLVIREYWTNSEDTEIIVDELIALLGTVPEKLEYRCPLSNNFTLLNYDISDGQIILNFNDHYNEQSIITEILVRAALVRTLTQVEGINNITITIRGEPFIDGTGNIVGSMNADMFIDNIGSEINAYVKTNLRLYFADEDGESLVAVNRNDIIYHSNTAIERLVIDTLIAGPEYAENVRATINPATRVLGVTTLDGTCDVNLDENFTQHMLGVNAEIVIYSIANSLIELPNVNRVRIAVNGETVTVFETVNLATVFERNLDVVR